MLHLVYCKEKNNKKKKKDHLQGYSMSSSLILGYFTLIAHTSSMEMSRFCVLVVCMYCIVCVSLRVRAPLLLLLVLKSARLRVIFMCYETVKVALFLSLFWLLLTSESEVFASVAR